VAEIVLIRHGQTEWSAAGRHTSRTDLPLTPDGERQARGLASVLAGRDFAAVLASPRERALRTAAMAGLAVTGVDGDLVEWDYGDYEGITTKQIRAERPDWDLWRDGCPGGESPEQVGARLDRVLARARAALAHPPTRKLSTLAHPPTRKLSTSAGGDVALVGHGHALRVAGARWAGLPVAAGGLLALDTGTLSTLGYEHERQVIRSWNARVS
jgi:broad specificity phosphatase PhoE